VTALLTAVAAWIGDTAGRMAIRFYAAGELVLAGTRAWTTAEPESPLTWEWEDEPAPLPANHRPSWAHDVPPPPPSRALDPYEIAEWERENEIREPNNLYRMPAAKEYR
jgi:hypothetical protein